MLKTYIYVGKEPTRIQLEKGKDKIVVEENQTIQTEIDLKIKDFILVGADSIKTISEKMFSIDKELENLGETEKQSIENIKKEFSEKEKEIKKMFSDRKVKLEEEKAFLEKQKESAKFGIAEKIKDLERQAKELDKSRAELEKEIVVEKKKK